MTNNDYWVALVELTFSLGSATASPPGRRAAHMARFSPGALAPARAGRRRGPAAGREADFNDTGFTGTAIQAMIEELSQELALKEANFGGYPGNPELLATEEAGRSMGKFLRKCPNLEKACRHAAARIPITLLASAV